jgi:hypothetical protein
MTAAYLTGFFAATSMGSDTTISAPANSASAALDIHNAPFGREAITPRRLAMMIPARIGIVQEPGLIYHE